MQGPRFGMIRIIGDSSTDSVARVSRAWPRGNLRQSIFSSRWRTHEPLVSSQEIFLAPADHQCRSLRLTFTLSPGRETVKRFPRGKHLTNPAGPRGAEHDTLPLPLLGHIAPIS